MLLNKSEETTLAENRRVFETLLGSLNAETQLSKRVKIAKKAIHFANSSSTGHFSSFTIENVFLDFANSIEDQIPTVYKPNTFLHVMSQCYSVGGHTRVVERWVELSPKNQQHSLLFTEKAWQKIPQRLTKAIQDKQGTITKLSNFSSDRQKAIRLRKIASEYEFIILHTHMHDTLPLMAFGSETFKRPVIHYNHADHRFWVGASIADVIAETRSWGTQISKDKRGVNKSFVLGIPNDPLIIAKNDKVFLRKKLGLPIEKKIIITAGSPNKYQPLGSMNFLSVAKQILADNPNSMLIGVGPDYTYLPEWKIAHDQSDGRICALGRKSSAQLFEYIQASDLALDSFPMSGGTALGDMTTAGCPVLALDCPTGHLDYLVNTSAICHDEATLINKAKQLLNSEVKSLENVREVTQSLCENDGIEKWASKLKKLYETAGSSHKITVFKTPTPTSPTMLDQFLLSHNLKPRRVFNIVSLFKVAVFLINGRIQVKLLPNATK